MTKFFPIIFLILALYFLVTGLRGVISKKPYVQSAKSNFWFIFLAFLPSMISPFESFWKMYSFDRKYSEPFDWTFLLMLFIPLLMFPVLLVFYWRMLKGYTVMGVTDESFRQEIYAVLNDLHLPFEERLSKLRLTSLDADLEVNVMSFMGTATVKIKQAQHQKTLEAIADGLRRYFAGSHVSINMTTCTYHIVFGVLTLMAAGVFGYYFAVR